MQIQKLSSNICYQKEYDILKSQLPDDFQNIIFNIAINECKLFPRFTIFKSITNKRSYFWMYIGSYSNNIVLMNIIFSLEDKFITSNRIYITKITPELYVNKTLKFKKFLTGIIDTLHIYQYDLQFSITNLVLTDFLDRDNFNAHVLKLN